MATDSGYSLMQSTHVHRSLQRKAVRAIDSSWNLPKKRAYLSLVPTDATSQPKGGYHPWRYYTDGHCSTPLLSMRNWEFDCNAHETARYWYPVKHMREWKTERADWSNGCPIFGSWLNGLQAIIAFSGILEDSRPCSIWSCARVRSLMVT